VSRITCDLPAMSVYVSYKRECDLFILHVELGFCGFAAMYYNYQFRDASCYSTA
jgi:hypothetical protein